MVQPLAGHGAEAVCEAITRTIITITPTDMITAMITATATIMIMRTIMGTTTIMITGNRRNDRA